MAKLKKLKYRIVKEEYLNRLIYLAEHDQLTGVYNRYGGVRRLEPMIDSGKPGYIVVLDVDSFKGYNDQHGHVVGDKVLRAVSDALTAISVQNVVRFGGDEFCAFWPHKNDDEACRKTFLSLTEYLSHHGIPEIEGQQIYVSVGAFYYDGKYATDLDELYRHADRLCYESKKKKGNCITIA